MNFQTNMPTVIENVNHQLTALQSDQMARLQAFSLLAVIKERIHVNGLDSNGRPIGTYSQRYMPTRLLHNRGSGRKVIISLTRQLEQGWHPEKIPNGWALCLASREDMEKARKCERIYKKQIFAPTAEEKALVEEIAREYIRKHIAQ